MLLQMLLQMLRIGSFICFSIFIINTQTNVFVSGMRQTMRREVILRQNNLCGICNENFSTMKPHEIHRLNHDAKDNNATNLLALCANCHTAHHRYGVPALPFIRGKITRDDNVRATNVYYEE